MSRIFNTESVRNIMYFISNGVREIFHDEEYGASLLTHFLVCTHDMPCVIGGRTEETIKSGDCFCCDGGLNSNSKKMLSKHTILIGTLDTEDKCPCESPDLDDFTDICKKCKTVF